MSDEPIYYDQYDRLIDDDPYPIFKRLREEAPLWYNEKYDFWVLSRFEDVRQASLDTDTFSSNYGTVLELMDDDPTNHTSIINEDPPYHNQLRAVVAPFFTPAKISSFEDEVREIVVGYLAPLEGKGEFDFVQDFARWVPMDVVSALLGIPQEDRKTINTWGDQINHRDEGQVELGPVQVEAFSRSNAYFENMLMQRRAHPRDDLASLIATGSCVDEQGERPLTTDEAVAMIQIIGIAGNETAARLLASAAWLLGKYPEQRQKLRDDPKLIPKAVEELLRIDPPSPIQFRRVLADVEMHGAVIPKGSNIGLLTASANRDDRQYEDPDRFDIERTPRRHVGFGYGIHSCLGAWVARLEVRVALEEVLARFPDWQVDEANMQRVRTSTVRGFSHVPVRMMGLMEH